MAIETVPGTASAPHGRLAENVAHFARALRAAGLPVGPGRVVEAVRAVAATGFHDREDFYWTLHACFVSRAEHRETFAQCFRLFWRDPEILERMVGLLLPEMRVPREERPPEAAEKRAAEALTAGADNKNQREKTDREELQMDMRLTFAKEEVLRTRDFEQMSAAELRAAERAIARLELPVKPIASRRTQVAQRGPLPDWRRTMRNAMRRGGEVRWLATRERRVRWPALVALCDISGSMGTYSRMLLHFLHAAANAKGAGWSRVHAFTFGTRLTNITRLIRARDVDDALSRAGREVADWEGGTRIGACLESFNRDWSRRVLAGGAVVLLITDGLDRDEPDRLAAAAERLHLSARRVIWLNPLLRWDGFEAKARGIAALLPHVDVFRSAHSVESLEAFAAALGDPGDHGLLARHLAG